MPLVPLMLLGHFQFLCCPLLHFFVLNITDHEYAGQKTENTERHHMTKHVTVLHTHLNEPKH
jgi:hypothetical protein